MTQHLGFEHQLQWVDPNPYRLDEDDRKPVIPHVWTIPEIHALPEFGNEHGWFYGLVDSGKGVEIAEILPGMGWTSIDPSDVMSAWLEIQRDLGCYRPKGAKGKP